MDDPKDQVVSPQSESEKTPISETPSEEQKTTPEVADTAEKPVETPDNEKGEPEKLPQTTEQAKAFQEMRRRIKELEEQVGEKKARQSAFDQLKPKYSPDQIQQAKEQVDINKFIDPTTGQFQAHLYNEAVNKTIDATRREAQFTASQTVAQSMDEARAKDKYPALDPESEEFNRDFEESVASKYFFQLYQGKNPSIYKIASKEAKVFVKDIKKVEQETTQKVKEQLTEKEQAALSASGRSQPGLSDRERLEVLQDRSRHGDNWAVAERLRRAK